jgi:hypothetical protein
MPVTQAEVDELRREGEARGLDDVDRTLQTYAEIIAFQIHQWRHFGADQAETLRDVELLLRALELDRESIREARDILLRLGYGRDLGPLMTALARRAKPRPPVWIERMRARAAYPAFKSRLVT